MQGYEIHPGYQGFTNDAAGSNNDIAVLFLNAPSTKKPADLAIFEPVAGSVVTLPGWGNTSENVLPVNLQ